MDERRPTHLTDAHVRKQNDNVDAADQQFMRKLEHRGDEAINKLKNLIQCKDGALIEAVEFIDKQP